MKYRTIMTHDASLKTVSVSIQTLVVSNKQMTLAVFRQLPWREIIGPDLNLLGQPWGLVNYFWNGCGYEDNLPHLHVVWALDGKLFRCCVGRVLWIGRHYTPRGDLDGQHYIEQAMEAVPYDQRGQVGEEAANQWNAVVDQLAALEQLFIAV